MQNVLHKYSGARGSLKLIHDGKSYTLNIETRDGSGTSTKTEIHDTYDLAWTQYLAQWRIFTGLATEDKKSAPQCHFNTTVCKCSADACPKILGGAAFWELFRNHCQYHTK